jgi:CheY-like chemotaxis protein
MSANPVTTVLLIEDNHGDARLLREMFRDGGAYQTKLTQRA